MANETGNWYMEHVTSLVGKELELVEEVERFPLDIVGLTSTDSASSGTKILERGWTLFYSGDAPVAAVKKGRRSPTGHGWPVGLQKQLTAYRQAKLHVARTVAEAKTRVWEEVGEAMEKDFRSALRFWQTIRRLRRGRLQLAHTVYSGSGELLTSTGQIVGRWKEYFKDLLNPTDTHSPEETEPGGSEVGALISGAEVAEALKQLQCSSSAPGVDEICPGYLKALDVVGLSWLTRLCNIACGHRGGAVAVPLEWQTGVVVPIFKKGGQRVYYNCRRITLLSLPGKV
ncbi:hypothetical protein L3Q82_010334 [Scortum barcoo]|uniref:Uncharacterized protein n=1 Tax=Scortum barcoo TaxID=214431 RepID=A0ACB8WD76_9TELE|nr:hypothetical protein L3Q82_010334 [Scortum barcoo]